MKQQFGKWETFDPIGEGGQGTVWLARQTEQGLDWRTITNAVQGLVNTDKGEEASRHQHAQILADLLAQYIESTKAFHAIKVFRGEIRTDSKARERLAREVEILSQEFHPNILKIIDSSTAEGWFVTPYYSRGPLARQRDMFKGKPLEALKAFRPLVAAVVKLHKNGVIHRDIKPENIYVSDTGLILGDFGLVHFEDGPKTRLSDTYENVGSRDWMPAWALGVRLEDVRPTFDIYSLGKVLWAMVAGKTKMNLWYYDDPEFNVVNLFPGNEMMHWINRILESCVVERESHCISNGEEFLNGLDDVIEIMGRGGRVINRGITRACRVCGGGPSRIIIDENSSDSSLLNFAPS